MSRHGLRLGVYALITGLLLALPGFRQGSEATEPSPSPSPLSPPSSPHAVEPGVWERVDATTISFTGDIVAGVTAAEFEKVFDSEVETVLLGSGGGDTAEALQIANTLKDAGIETRAVGLCASSCANYLFPAGQTKVIDGGVVGYHGNAKALADQLGGVDALVAVMEEQARQQGVSEEEIATYRERTERMLQLEEEFLSDLGIDQALFDRTQRDDKGMDDGQDYALFLPSPETFERYGIAGVQGDHSEELVETLEEKYGAFARE